MCIKCYWQIKEKTHYLKKKLWLVDQSLQGLFIPLVLFAVPNRRQAVRQRDLSVYHHNRRARKCNICSVVLNHIKNVKFEALTRETNFVWLD